MSAVSGNTCQLLSVGGFNCSLPLTCFDVKLGNDSVVDESRREESCISYFVSVAFVAAVILSRSHLILVSLKQGLTLSACAISSFVFEIICLCAL